MCSFSSSCRLTNLGIHPCHRACLPSTFAHRPPLFTTLCTSSPGSPFVRSANALTMLPFPTLSFNPTAPSFGRHTHTCVAFHPNSRSRSRPPFVRWATRSTAYKTPIHDLWFNHPSFGSPCHLPNSGAHPPCLCRPTWARTARPCHRHTTSARSARPGRRCPTRAYPA